MQEVLNDELSSKHYDAEETTKWSKDISDAIKEKLKSIIPYTRYFLKKQPVFMINYFM